MPGIQIVSESAILLRITCATGFEANKGIGLSKDIVPQNHTVTAAQRAALKRQQPCVLWFTGRSSAGKAAIASALDHALHERGYHTYLLDSASVLHKPQSCNVIHAGRACVGSIERIAAATSLLTDAGLIVLGICSLPLASDRKLLRAHFEPGRFIEVDTDAPQAISAARSARALHGHNRTEAQPLPAVAPASEPPVAPDLQLDVAAADEDVCVARLLGYLEGRGLIHLSAWE